MQGINTNYMSVLPVDALTIISPYLDLKAFCAVTSTCKAWRKVFEIDELWKLHCLERLEDTKPYQNSWKKRFIILQNLLLAQGTITTRTTISKDWSPCHGFALLKDNTVSEICPDPDDQLTYQMRSLSLEEEEIRLKPFEKKRVMCWASHDNIMLMFNSQGNILIYDMELKKRVAEFVPFSKEAPFGSSYIYKMNFNGEDIVLANHKKIYVIDYKDRKLSETYSIMNDSSIKTLQQSKLYIAYTSYNNQVFIIDKKSKKVFKINGLVSTCDICSISAVGEFIALQSKQGSITILKGELEGIKRVHVFNAFDRAVTSSSGYLKIYKNWLFANCGDLLQIWDLRSGKKLTEIKLQNFNSHIQFQMNDAMFVTRIRRWSIGGQEYLYTTYNFENPTTTFKYIPEKPRSFCSIL